MYELEFFSLLCKVAQDVLLFEDQEEFLELTLLSFEVNMLLPTGLSRIITWVLRHLVHLSQLWGGPAPNLQGILVDSWIQ